MAIFNSYVRFLEVKISSLPGFLPGDPQAFGFLSGDHSSGALDPSLGDLKLKDMGIIQNLVIP